MLFSNCSIQYGLGEVTVYRRNIKPLNIEGIKIQESYKAAYSNTEVQKVTSEGCREKIASSLDQNP